MTTDDPRSTSAVEVKWGIHAASDRRSQWTEPLQVTTLSILTSQQQCQVKMDTDTNKIE
ncbi:MAG: hypothetical protein SFY66_16135 [Oculatellaceae cyanobacterium bins.114]|nr:hypothetical protein [Oculatellaceae cyanobacterium bins.114]